eukprot:GHRQ01015553.1.p1 GENE.GHRQ01015553.1~~GHRQ01015553.1.p1  ORF type:complete len:130 (-),score=46.92 GHRQ01015553.1:610-999(-)
MTSGSLGREAKEEAACAPFAATWTCCQVPEVCSAAATLQDTDSVVDSLETGMGLLAHLVFFCFYLLVWGINIVKGFTTFSATVLALTFVFGNSARSVFEVRDLLLLRLAAGPELAASVTTPCMAACCQS